MVEKKNIAIGSFCNFCTTISEKEFSGRIKNPIIKLRNEKEFVMYMNFVASESDPLMKSFSPYFFYKEDINIPSILPKLESVITMFGEVKIKIDHKKEF